MLAKAHTFQDQGQGKECKADVKTKVVAKEAKAKESKAKTKSTLPGGANSGAGAYFCFYLLNALAKSNNS